MIIQWCMKGIGGLSDSEALDILQGGEGLTCQWWRNYQPLPWGQVPDRLTEHHLDMHVNHYDEVDPSTGQAFYLESPFISLSAGCISRDVYLRTNVLHRAQRTAVAFATNWGSNAGHVFTCYVIVGINRATPIPGVAEEIRDLNHARPYSDYHVEGEVAAKIQVPAVQLRDCDRWEPGAGDPGSAKGAQHWTNPRFQSPDVLINMRGML